MGVESAGRCTAGRARAAVRLPARAPEGSRRRDSGARGRSARHRGRARRPRRGPAARASSSSSPELDVPVHLLGRVPDVAAWLRRADLLVHPARWEGFGLALLEAMLASQPVVATTRQLDPGDRGRRRDRTARSSGRRTSSGGCRHACSREPGTLRRARPRAAQSRSSASHRWPTGLLRFTNALARAPSVEQLGPVGAALLEELLQSAGGAPPRPSPPPSRGRPQAGRSLPRAALPRREGRGRPVTPSSTSSPRPPISAAITGRARSIASSATMPKPSPIDGTTTIADSSIACWTGET